MAKLLVTTTTVITPYDESNSVAVHTVSIYFSTMEKAEEAAIKIKSQNFNTLPYRQHAIALDEGPFQSREENLTIRRIRRHEE